MKLDDVVKALGATVLTERISTEMEVSTAFASDLMSDVLAYSQNSSILITGLCNPQIVRTAEMMDVSTIILARGKQANEDLIELAEECGVCLISSERLVFSICAILSDIGVVGGGKNVE